MADKVRIRVASVSTDAPFGDNRPGDFVQVTFRVYLQEYRVDIPVFVNANAFEDTNVIRVARSHFANLLDGLAHQTQNWRMTDAELRAFRDAQGPAN